MFVGAGPGAHDLLTARAIARLREADVIVHDRLVPDGLFTAVAAVAERIPAPESGGGEDRGSAIGRLLVELASRGRLVVRLKGGDPGIFSRLEEELEPLRGGDETAAMSRDAAASDRSPGSEGREAAAEGRARVRSGRGRKRQAERHVSGQQLCEAARLFGLQQYGFLAPKVLESWGIRRTDDLGEIVFNMIEIGQMRKTRSDKRDHFRAVYDFAEAFSRDLSFAVPDVV